MVEESILDADLGALKLDLSRISPPVRLAFIVLEGTVSVIMGEKQSIFLPTRDSYEPQRSKKRQLEK